MVEFKLHTNDHDHKHHTFYMDDKISGLPPHQDIANEKMSKGFVLDIDDHRIQNVHFLTE